MNQGGGDCRLGAYEVLRCIGKGSYGEVYLVAAGVTRKQYVMKNIKLSGSTAKERLGAEQEAALLSHLSHPNIVSYKESFQDDSGTLHIVMGYCEGGDLHSRLKTYGNLYLPETKVVEWFVQIALGLQYLHNRKILHRDLKTQNIFLSKNDIIKVGDLGIARVLDGSCDLAHTVIGTPYYMSPELFANQPYNHKSDIWALGCCVHEIASLRHAFSARNINALMYKVIQGKVPPIPSHYSKELVQMVQDMLSPKAEKRPDVQEILHKEFIRRHIRMFLERASGRKRKGKPLPPSAPALCVSGELRNIKQAEIAPKEQVSQDESSKQILRADSNSTDEVVSSARQRRRRNKQQEGHVRILSKARRNEAGNEVRMSADEAGRSTNSAEQRESSISVECVDSNGGHVDANEDPDGGCVGTDGDPDGGHVDTNGDPDGGYVGTDGDPDGGHVDTNGDPDGGRVDTNGDPDGGRVDTNGDPDGGHVDTNGDPDGGHGCSDDWNDQQDEVEDFYTLLDSTLRLSQAEVQCSDLASSPLASTPPKDKMQLSSGRLAERIKALRTECESVLGPSVVHQVLELLSGIDPEDSMDNIKLAIGTEDFEVYSAKLQQLKLCQDSITNNYS